MEARYGQAMADPNGLATFLRTRRDLLKPSDVGLRELSGERRRVAGLRREEVSILAGISQEYYVRLEQGRERQPSDQVLESLARALQLDDDASEYMRNLARPAAHRRRRDAAERVDPGIETLISSWHLTPAYVQGRRMTILAANPMARALWPFFAPEVNLFRATFLEPELRCQLRNWDAVTAITVSWLRFVVGEDITDPELQSLVDELSVASPQFRKLWARHDVKQKTSGPALFDHPQVGQLDLCYRVFVLPETRQALVTYYAEPGSPSEDRLHSLSSLMHSPPPL
jgi:transcriptional regulator with XRE-family HTH domain